MCKEMPLIPGYRVADKKRMIGKNGGPRRRNPQGVADQKQYCNYGFVSICGSFCFSFAMTQGDPMDFTAASGKGHFFNNLVSSHHADGLKKNGFASFTAGNRHNFTYWCPAPGIKYQEPILRLLNLQLQRHRAVF
jgi:hypothetical protein